MAISEAELREQVFSLRGQNPPVSFQKIADQLGVSKGIVYRLFHQPAKATAESNGGVGPVPRAAAAYEEDPVLAAAARRLEAKKLELQEKQLDRQLTMLDGKAASGDAGMMMILLNQMERMKEDVDRKLALQTPSRPPEDPMTGMVRAMGVLAELKDKAALLAPPPAIPAATSAADVELRVLLEKMNLETEAVRQRAADAAQRNQWMFSMAKDNLPLIIDGVKTFFANQQQQQAAAPRPPTLQVLAGGRTEVIDPGTPQEIPMTCASCGAKAAVRPEPGEIPLCPACGSVLQAELAPAPPKPFWPEDSIIG